MTRQLLTIIITLMAISCAHTSPAQSTYLIEGEAFQFKGKWVVEKSSDCLGTAMLRVYQDNNSAPEADALTVVNILEAGEYHVWTRSQDFLDSARPRTYTLSIDGNTMSPAGNHGSAGFRWEHVGTAVLQRKPTLLRLTDTGHYYGRCDAILLTRDPALDPNTLTNADVARWRRNPMTMDYTDDNIPSLTPSLDITPGYTTLASASNDEIRISFVRLPDAGGHIVCKTDFRQGGSWRRFSSTAEDNRLAIISSATRPAFNHNEFYPAWDTQSAHRTMTFEGTDYTVSVDGDNTNPYFTGTLYEPRATAVTKVSAGCIKVTYDCGPHGSLTGYWTVPGSGSHIETRFVYEPAADGCFTLMLHGAKGISDTDCRGALMPPMFAGDRLPATPLTLFSSMMSQCIATVSTSGSFGTYSSFVAADLSTFTDSWGSYDYSPVGFSLRNSEGQLQPVALAPLPGMSDSEVHKGRPIEVRFITGIVTGGWDDALAYASDNIFGVTDYRRPSDTSLNDILNNLTDLIKDDNASGWEQSLKGFWDIEADGTTAPTVVQSSPLSIVGAATLTHDEELYATRALPTIEYLLSRSGYRTRANAPSPLNPLTSQFPTTLYEGLNTLTGALNPWLETLALPDGNLRASNGYFSTLRLFTQELSAYRLTADVTHLDNAVSLADACADEILAGHLPAMAQGSFYNSQMIPDWTPLIDIYNITGNERYLDAARLGASHTLAGIKSWPRVATGSVTVHPGDRYDGVTTIWWKGPEQFRLGFPRHDGDAPAHDVDAWSVSSVGLGMEQPATYFLRSAGKTVRPVFMSNWAPRLMELASLSGRDIFDIYARNAVIGRAANYPGYYATGYTDITASPTFPYQGPDVSSIYYHHIPAYMGMIQDYLVTEFIARSEGRFTATRARQEGFVWFANNISGRTPATILGDAAELYMPARWVTADTPDINLLTARNADHIYILVTNDGNDRIATTLTLSDDLRSHLTEPRQSISVSVSPRDIEIITLDASCPDYGSLTPLTDGMEVIATGTPAGNIYLYRVRSPFGWDSLYGFADCTTTPGLTIQAESNGRATTATDWPYEWSFARYGYDDDAPVTVTILIDGKPVGTVSHTFGSTAGIGTVTGSDRPATPGGIYTIDGRRLTGIPGPGLYIVDGHKTVVTR
ncbi:MAG: hypothetical protein HDR82_05505 [Bacteroides sp.]|nr:hypothetical protein [Bacteroides sp.]